jgi:hypothetical protein
MTAGRKQEVAGKQSSTSGQNRCKAARKARAETSVKCRRENRKKLGEKLLLAD